MLRGLIWLQAQNDKGDTWPGPSVNVTQDLTNAASKLMGQIAGFTEDEAVWQELSSTAGVDQTQWKKAAESLAPFTELRGALAQERREKGAVQKQLDDLKASQQQLDAVRTSATTTLQEELRKTKEKFDALQQQVPGAQQVGNDALNKMIDDLTTRLNTAEKASKDLQTKLDAATAGLPAGTVDQATHDAVLKQLQEAQELVSERDAALSQVRAELSKLEAEKANLPQKLQEAEKRGKNEATKECDTRVAEMQAIIEATKQSAETLQQQLETYKKDSELLVAANQARAEAQTLAEGYKRENESLNDQVEQLKRRLSGGNDDEDYDDDEDEDDDDTAEEKAAKKALRDQQSLVKNASDVIISEQNFDELVTNKKATGQYVFGHQAKWAWAAVILDAQTNGLFDQPKNDAGTWSYDWYVDNKIMKDPAFGAAQKTTGDDFAAGSNIGLAAIVVLAGSPQLARDKFAAVQFDGPDASKDLKVTISDEAFAKIVARFSGMKVVNATKAMEAIHARASAFTEKTSVADWTPSQLGLAAQFVAEKQGGYVLSGIIREESSLLKAFLGAFRTGTDGARGVVALRAAQLQKLGFLVLSSDKTATIGATVREALSYTPGQRVTYEGATFIASALSDDVTLDADVLHQFDDVRIGAPLSSGNLMAATTTADNTTTAASVFSQWFS